MANVVFVSIDGTRRDVDVASGKSVMQAAVSHGVTEIVAECGGTLACATCHVYVAEDMLDRLPPMSEDENEMLDYTASPRKPNSRLSCQLKLNDETLDGLVVELPEEQY